MFCAHCGTLLYPKKTPYGSWLSCPDGHTQPELVKDAPTIKRENFQRGEKISVGDGKNNLATHDHRCKYCSHTKAELLEIAPFYSDEDFVVRMKCGRCGRVEQLDGKVK